MSNIRENLGLSSTNNVTPNTNSNIRKNLGITSNNGSSIRSNLGLNNYKSNTKATTPVASKEKVNGKITLANLSDVTLGGSKFLDDGYQLGDASKTLLSSIGSAANYLGQGVLKGAEGIFDAAYNLGTSNLNPYYWFNQDKLKEHQEIAKEVTQKNAVEELMKTVTKDNNFKLSEFNNKVLDPYSIVKSNNLAGQVVQGVGQMLPSIALGNPTVGTGMIGASSYGSGVEEAYNNGATHNQAKLYGLGNAATEIATEWLTGGIPGIKSSGGIDKYVAKGLGLKSIDEVSKSLSKEIIKAGYKVVGEGAEEALSEIINPFLKQFTYEHNNDKNFIGNVKEAISKEDLSKIINSAIVGGITGGILEAPINISSIKASKQLLQNNMQNSPLYSTNSNKTTLPNINSQNNNNLQVSTLELQNTGMYQYNKESNEKINSLKESAKNYFDNSEETHNYLDTISKIISDKNYNITFNDKIVDKMGVINPNINGKISTGLDGNVSIEINPKSPKAGEFIIMHEITHSIENNEIKSLVLDYASKNQEFNSALNSLKETYRTDDVSSEVLADISGQLFGNQEFINNLSMKKPNVFKSIYNKIVEIANKVTGNSKETLFIKNLKIKWEKAYRSQNSNLNETEYSKGKLLNGEDVVISDDVNGTHVNKDDAKKSLNSMLGTNYLNESNNTNLKIENKDIKKFLNDGYNNYKSNDLKRRIVGNYGEILELAKIDSNGSQSNYKSSNRGILGYDYYNINLAYPVKDSLGNILNYKYYEARLVVRKELNGDFAYDLDKFTQKKGTVLDKINLSIAADKSARGPFSANNISQSGTDVKSDISTKYSMQNNKKNTSWDKYLNENYKHDGTTTDMKKIEFLPVFDKNSSIKNEKFVSLPIKYDEDFLNHKIKEYQELDTSKMSNESKEIIAEELSKYKKELLKLKGINGDPTKETTYNSNEEINELDTKKQRKTKIKEYRELASLYTKDMTQWKDKGLASQKINTMKRNLMDIMPQKQAEDIYEEYFVPIRENNATIEKEITKYNNKIESLKLNQKESTAIQMLGEYKYNPETLVTGMQVEKYISDNKLDYNKISDSVEKFRSIYDEMFGKVNEVLEEQGYSKLGYKKGYFPHFINDKGTNVLQRMASKLGWKFNDQKLPTDIAGLTDMFLPGKKWTSFSQHRKGKSTDYDALKGFDSYVRGAMETIYHTEDIQKLRGLENQIRYQHSDKGLQEEIDKISENETLSQEKKEKLIDDAYLNSTNPLSNFVTNLRDFTNGIPGKKSSLDRNIEQFVGRKWYNTMENIQTRTTANMVGMNISSALTNFIPITQAWSQISTKNMIKAISQSITSNFTNDAFENNSIYLTNRLNKADKLSKTILEKTADKAGFLFEAVDSFTSNVIVRGKYLENIDKGMSQVAALKNADEFANDVMAGRSKGDMPTIFNAKNPFIKLFTSFQLEVNNQYGYMFKDLPKDLKDEGMAKLIMAFLKMFLGAWLYNKVNESLTGRKSAFSPIDIMSEIIETSENENLSSFNKISKTTESLAQQLPFVGGLLGGGRLPVSSALPSLSTVTENAVNLGDDSKRKTAIENLKKELMKPVFYVVMPFGGGQLKKTLEGASMYSHDIPGSYTSSGDLRFSVGTDPLSKAQALVFGQYSSKNARDYFDNNSSALNEKQMSEYKDLGLPISEYRDIKSGLSKLKKTEDKIDYITGLSISKLQKNIILNNNLTNNSYVDVEDYKNYSSYDEYVFAKNSEDKYSVIKNFNIPYSNYNNYVDNIDYIRKQYSETDERKAAVYNYINSQSISIVQKVAMFKLAGYSIKSYQDSMFNYINNLKLSKSEKEQIWKYLYS